MPNVEPPSHRGESPRTSRSTAEERLTRAAHAGIVNPGARYSPSAEDELVRLGAELERLQSKLKIEKARAERLSVAKNKFEEANRSKASFLATMSHEMRTPLTSILGITDLLSESEADAHTLQQIKRIDSNAIALQSIIEDILDYSKLESGQLKLHKDHFRPARAIEKAWERMSEAARQKGLQLIKSTAHDLPVRVVGDQERIVQVLVNLVGNAIKFTEQGTVTISAELIPGEPLGVRYQVTDTGAGIPLEEQKKVFNRFYRCNLHAPGTGLGLSICKQLVDLMSGEIHLESKWGFGSEFTVDLVHDKPHARSLERKNIEYKNRLAEDIRVLLVEDHLDNRSLMAHYLSHAGCRVDTADEGRTAQIMLEGTQYHALVTDLNMPGLDGFNLMQWVRQREAEERMRRLPIVVVTACA
ncbi:MAG: ATP-binding protein, partial [Polyangiaceae bacterium]|nr:ATP-binding protein [Polyangiaceae bacterium]